MHVDLTLTPTPELDAMRELIRHLTWERDTLREDRDYWHLRYWAEHPTPEAHRAA